MNTPLVTIIVLSYKNLDHLDECLESIFTQTYQNIELIISNDGAVNFNDVELLKYLNKRRTDQFKRIVINKNERNLGTVKHCNKLIDMTTGEYVMFIACDDIYYSKTTIQEMVEGFKEAPVNTMCIVAQCAMCNDDLSICNELYVDEETKVIINELSPQELYKKHLVHRAVFPAAAMIYKRESFYEYGKFNEKYCLIEDWTSSIAFAKQGMRFYYHDVMCIKHRDGGISHSGINPQSFAQKMYYRDELIQLEEILKQKSELDKDDYQKINHKYLWLRNRYEQHFVIPNLEGYEKLIYNIKNYKFHFEFKKFQFKTEKLKAINLRRKNIMLRFATYPLQKIFLTLSYIYILSCYDLFVEFDYEPLIKSGLRYAIYSVILIYAMQIWLKKAWKLKARVYHYILHRRAKHD